MRKSNKSLRRGNRLAAVLGTVFLIVAVFMFVLCVRAYRKDMQLQQEEQRLSEELQELREDD